MTMAARLQAGETLGDRILKVDHTGEHGAVCIYRAQRWIARWRASDLLVEIDDFIAHEQRHRALFGEELQRRGRRRCRSYLLCGLAGFVLGGVTGLLGRQAIAATTAAIETVVLRHLMQQLAELAVSDPDACRIIRSIVDDEQQHRDLSVARLSSRGLWPRIILPVVSLATEGVIWTGMKL